MNINNQVAAKIKEVRENKKMLLKYVAEGLNLSPASYSRIENGQTQITIDVLYKVALLLEISVNELLVLEEKTSFNNYENTVYQQGVSHTLNLNISPEDFNKIFQLLKKQ